MVKDYFSEVVESLTVDDMNVLSYLYERDVDAAFKAIVTSDILVASGLPEGTFRRITYRLIANKFIEVVNVKKHNALYITKYGVHAVHKSTDGVSA